MYSLFLGEISYSYMLDPLDLSFLCIFFDLCIAENGVLKPPILKVDVHLCL